MAEQGSVDTQAGGESSGKKKLIVTVGVALVIAGVAAGAGWGAGGLFRPSDADAEQTVEDLANAGGANDPAPEDPSAWTYIPIETLTITTNTHRTRHIIFNFAMKVPAETAEEVNARMEKASPEVKSRLLTYLADLTPDDVRGERNHNRILREVRDRLNALLWPNAKPRIEAVVFTKGVLVD